MTAISLVLLLGVPLLTGYAQWWEIVAVVLGLALLAVEIFMIPGFGVTGISGILLVLVGLIMTFVPKEPGGLPGILPHLRGTWDAIQQGLLVVVGGLACSMALWLWLNRYLPKLPYLNHLILTATSGGSPSATELPSTPAPAPDVWPAVGTIGTAITDLRPGGSASFPDETLGDNRMADVISDSGFVRAGVKVVVREASASSVVVRAISG